MVENTSWNSRYLFASVDIAAPVDTVWNTLNDYEKLASFIPSLVENRCLRKKNDGAVLYQVGPLTCCCSWQAIPWDLAIQTSNRLMMMIHHGACM
jgi:hypothetical protein